MPGSQPVEMARPSRPTQDVFRWATEMHAHFRCDPASPQDQAAMFERFHADLTTVLRSYQSA
jgi:hypothetical protein